MVAMARGYVSGFEDGSFRPNVKIVRQDAAVMICKCLKLEEDSKEKTSAFKDEKMISDYAKKYVEQLSELKIITGDEKGRFNPKKETTRAEAVALLDRAYAYYESLVANGVNKEEKEKEKTSEEQQGQSSENEKDKEAASDTTDDKKQAEENDKQEENDNSESENSGNSSLDVPIGEKELEELLASEVDELDTIYIGFGFSDDEQCVTQDLTLPSKTEKGTSINWSSNNTNMISNSGKVTRPSGTSVNVILTATITNKEGTKSKQFPLKVIRKSDGEIPHDNSYEEIVEINGEEPKIYTVDEQGTPTFIYAKVTDMSVECPEDAIRALNSVKTLMHMEDPEKEFIWSDTQSDNGMRFYRLQQIYKGAVVEGAKLNIATRNGKISSINGYYKPYEEFIDLDIEEANRKVDTARSSALRAIDDLEIVDEDLIIRFSEKKNELFWRFKGYSQKEGEAWVLVKLEGNIVSIEKTVAQFATSNKPKWLKKTINGIECKYPIKTFSNGTYLCDGDRNITVCFYVPSQENMESKEDYSGDLENKRTKASDWKNEEILAYYQVSRVYDYWKSRVGKDRIGKACIYFNSPIWVYVNTKGINYMHGKCEQEVVNAEFVLEKQNKFSSGEGRYNEIKFGRTVSGDNSDLIQNSLDLVAHEYVHGIEEIKFGETITTGGQISSEIRMEIGEAYSDILGALIAQRLSGKQEADWIIGEESYVGNKEIAGMRDLSNPKNQYMNCPGYDKYSMHKDKDMQKRYENSMILSHAAYTIWKEGIGVLYKERWDNSSWDVDEYINLWYHSMNYFLNSGGNGIYTEDGNYHDIATNVMASAFDLNCTHKQVSEMIKGFKKVELYPKVEYLGGIQRYWFYDDMVRVNKITSWTQNDKQGAFKMLTQNDLARLIEKVYDIDPMFKNYYEDKIKEYYRIEELSKTEYVTTKDTFAYIAIGLYYASMDKVDPVVKADIGNKAIGYKGDYSMLLATRLSNNRQILYGKSRANFAYNEEMYYGLLCVLLGRTLK